MRIAGGIFVHVGGAVADPLPRHEDRQLHVVFDLAHLERRGVPVPHQVADQPGILADPARAAAVDDPRRLHDGRVVAHVVDDADEAVIEHRHGVVEHAPPAPARWRARVAAVCARALDFGLLVGGERHRLPPSIRARQFAYIRIAGHLPAMAINGAWNKRCGPGGSARRLHQTPDGQGYGGDTGSTRVVKSFLLPGMVPPLSGHITSANDNHQALAVAA